jgi:hypothetical protein
MITQTKIQPKTSPKIETVITTTYVGQPIMQASTYTLQDFFKNFRDERPHIYSIVKEDNGQFSLFQFNILDLIGYIPQPIDYEKYNYKKIDCSQITGIFHHTSSYHRWLFASPNVYRIDYQLDSKITKSIFLILNDQKFIHELLNITNLEIINQRKLHCPPFTQALIQAIKVTTPLCLLIFSVLFTAITPVYPGFIVTLSAAIFYYQYLKMIK